MKLENFYGNITAPSKLHFDFDKIYESYTSMQENAQTDEIFVGRFVLVRYDYVYSWEEFDKLKIENNYFYRKDGSNIIYYYRNKLQDSTVIKTLSQIKSERKANDGADYHGTVWQKVYNKINNVEEYLLVCTLEEPIVSSVNDGLMSKEDKVKLDSIEEGANKGNYTLEAKQGGNNVAYVDLKKEDTVVSEISLHPGNSFGFTVSEPGQIHLWGFSASAGLNRAGLMSVADKQKLDNIRIGDDGSTEINSSIAFDSSINNGYVVNFLHNYGTQRSGVQFAGIDWNTGLDFIRFSTNSLGTTTTLQPGPYFNDYNDLVRNTTSNKIISAANYCYSLSLGTVYPDDVINAVNYHKDLVNGGTESSEINNTVDFWSKVYCGVQGIQCPAWSTDMTTGSESGVVYEDQYSDLDGNVLQGQNINIVRQLNALTIEFIAPTEPTPFQEGEHEGEDYSVFVEYKGKKAMYDISISTKRARSFTVVIGRTDQSYVDIYINWLIVPKIRDTEVAIGKQYYDFIPKTTN